MTLGLEILCAGGGALLTTEFCRRARNWYRSWNAESTRYPARVPFSLDVLDPLTPGEYDSAPLVSAAELLDPISPGEAATELTFNPARAQPPDSRMVPVFTLE